jgi:hypothetical protein
VTCFDFNLGMNVSVVCIGLVLKNRKIFKVEWFNGINPSI